LQFAQLIAKYRDSTYYMNFGTNMRFLKVGEINMTPTQIKENIIQALNYVSCVVPYGGLNNIMRISLHLNKTIIQLPFYHNVDAHNSYQLDVCHRKKLPKSKRKMDELQLKQYVAKQLDKQVIDEMVKTNGIDNLSHFKSMAQCTNKVTDLEQN